MKVPVGRTGIDWHAFAVPLAATLAASAAFAQAVPSVTAKLAPGQAISLGLANGDIYARTAEKNFTETGGRERLAPSVRAELRTALLEHPLHARAIRLLALDTELGGDKASATRLMRVSNRVSRRDLPTQFWLLREEATAGNWDAALTHLDAGLSTKANIWPQLFPVMTGQLSDARLRTSIAALLREGRPWTIAFINFAVKEGPDVELLDEFFREATPLPGGQPVRDLLAPVIARLVAAGKIAQARAFAIEVIDVAPRQIDDLVISTADNNGVAEPLVWQRGQAEGLSVSYEGGSARIFATVTSPASALTRYMMVTPGSSYALRYSAEQSGTEADETLEWVIQCPDGASLLPIHREALVSSTGSTETNFQVPKGCPAIRIDLVVDSPSTGNGVALKVVPIALTRI